MQIKSKNILVTGGLGFIGSHIVESLLKEGANVRILDNYSTGTEENIQSVIKDVEIIKGDILNIADLKKAIKGIDLVSHQAAQLEITRAIDDPIEDLTTNTIGTLNLFKVCAGVNRIVMASSAGVYGQAVKVPQKEDSHPTEPNWAYGVSKLANEKYAMIMKDLYGLRVTNFRYAIVYGPREWYGRVLTIFLKRALDNKPLIIFGDGEQIRDFVFVSDLVKMHNMCIKNDKSMDQIFNISTGRGTSINNLAKMILKASGKDLEIIHENVKEGEKSKYFERKRLPMELKVLTQSNAKAKKLVGWSPETKLEKGLAAEWDWLVENKNRWKKMSY
jgi:UDP-glucose 4-epimerase